jgi:hypothetical protein
MEMERKTPNLDQTVRFQATSGYGHAAVRSVRAVHIGSTNEHDERRSQQEKNAANPFKSTVVIIL